MQRELYLTGILQRDGMLELDIRVRFEWNNLENVADCLFGEQGEVCRRY
jgi:hypothetical protein